MYTVTRGVCFLEVVSLVHNVVYMCQLAAYRARLTAIFCNTAFDVLLACLCCVYNSLILFFCYAFLIKKLENTLCILFSTLFVNVALVFLHMMKTFSKDFLEVRGVRSRGFQLLLHELQQHCARNFEKKCEYASPVTGTL